MTLGSAIANYGLSAIGTPTGTNVANDMRIGLAPTSAGFADADIAYSFKVTATAPLDVATLTLSTGAVVQTTGTPTIDDGGTDFEGLSLPTAAFTKAILIECPTDSLDDVTVTFTDTRFPDVALSTGDVEMSIHANNTATGTMSMSFADVGACLIVTIIGKTT